MKIKFYNWQPNNKYWNNGYWCFTVLPSISIHIFPDEGYNIMFGWLFWAMVIEK